MTILLYVLIVIFILGSVLFVGIGIFTENPIFMFGTYVFLALAIVCICMLPNKNPSKLYQEKVEAVEKANKELEKFLIDYPEFKEERTMKKMIYNAPLAYFGILMNGQKVKVGYWNLFADGFEKDLPVFEGCMGDLMREEKSRIWAGMKMKKVNHLSAEGDVVVIGVDRYDD